MRGWPWRSSLARNFGSIGTALGFPGLPALADGPYSAIVALGFLRNCRWFFGRCLVDKVHRRPSTGIDWGLRRPVADVLDDSIIKIAGLWATWAVIASIYALCRFYWDGSYLFSMQMFQAAAIPLIILSVPYVVWLDRYLINPRDGAWHLGAWIAGRADWDSDEIFHHLARMGGEGAFSSPS